MYSNLCSCKIKLYYLPNASLMLYQVEEKPDVTYSDVGGCKEQIDKLREVVETPLLHVSIKIVVMHIHVFAIL